VNVQRGVVAYVQKPRTWLEYGALITVNKLKILHRRIKIKVILNLNKKNLKILLTRQEILIIFLIILTIILYIFEEETVT